MHQIITVTILNDLKKRIAVTSPDFTVQQLFDTVCEKIALVDYQFFAIAEQLLDEYGAPLDRFLDFSSTLIEERVTPKSILALKVKHVKRPVKIEDPVAQELIFKQIQQNIVNEIYPCPERVAILLASIELQIQFGDYDAKKHRVGYLNKVGLSSYLPKTVSRHDYAYWQERLFALHANHFGLSKTEAIEKYIQTARDIPYYGMSFFELKDDAGLEILAAVAEDGVYLFNSANLKLLQVLLFDVLVQWNKTESGVDLFFEEHEEVQAISLITTPIKQKEILTLLDEYYVLLPDKFKKSRVKPYNPNPLILDEPTMYHEPSKRVFLGRFGSRLEYMKAYYMESCALHRIQPIRKLCQQIDVAIDTNDTLTSLDVSRSEISDQFAHIITKMIWRALNYEPDPGFQWTENLNIVSFDISGNSIGQKFNVVLELFADLKSVRSINLSQCDISNKGAISLGEALHVLNKIEELILNECNIGNKGLAALCEVLMTKKKFKALLLADNRISDVAPIIKILGECQTLKTLDLSSNSIDTRAMEQLLKVLESNVNLEVIKIANNPFGTKLRPRVNSLLSVNKTLKEVDLGSSTGT